MLLASVLLPGCPVDPCEEDPASCTPGTPVALLGSTCSDTELDPSCTNPSAFAPLVDGASIAVHMGPQGGFHVFLSVRVSDMDPGDPESSKGSADNPVVIWTVYDGETILGTRTLQVGLLPGPDGSWERSQVAVILDEDYVISPMFIDGRTLRIELTVTDANGLTAADEAQVVAVGILG